MTSRVPFCFVDVFASQPLTGNPLALVTDADGLTEPQMRAIAREFNQSETTFLLHLSLPGATWRLRSFTPIGAEVAGAGHNALGAWLWLAASGRLGYGRGELVLAQEIAGEVLPVRVIRESPGPATVWMSQSPPWFGDFVRDRAELAAALGLTEGDLVAEDAAQVVCTGAGHLMVPARDRAAVDRAAPDPARLVGVLRAVGAEGCYLYSPDPVDGAGAVAYARFFNPGMGIAEDPATGTAAGPLVARFAAAGQVPDNSTAIVEQGYALGRPSRIQVKVAGQQVQVGGSGLVVADGTLYL